MHCRFIDNLTCCPAGYADNLAIATISKCRSDAVHGIVVEYVNLWRFKFYPGKSAVLIYSESKKSHVQNSRNRVF